MSVWGKVWGTTWGNVWGGVIIVTPAAPCRTYYVGAETRTRIVDRETRIMEATCP